MKSDRIVAAITLLLLSGCATTGFDLNRPELDGARKLIEQARQAGAEQCAPRLLAQAQAGILAAAHELSEGDEHHWEQNGDTLDQALRAARAALARCKARRGQQHHPATGQKAATATRPLAVVYFGFDRATAGHGERARLIRLLPKLRRHRLSIEGHADEIGPAGYNLRLSRRRARHVAELLRRHGIAGEAIARIVGYGETRPADPGHSRAAHRRNRRVEIRLMEAPPAPDGR